MGIFAKKAVPVLILASLAGACATIQQPASPAMRVAAVREIVTDNPYHATLKMTGRAEIKTEKGWVKSKTSLLVRRPDSFRVTLFGPTGAAWFVGVGNARYIGYAAPSENARKVVRKTEGASVRIGHIKLRRDDFVRFIQPGLETAWLENSQISVTKKGFRIARRFVVYDLKLDDERRFESVVIKRVLAAPVRYSYEYSRDGGYMVDINNKIRFHIDRVVEDVLLPDYLFSLPPL